MFLTEIEQFDKLITMMCLTIKIGFSSHCHYCRHGEGFGGTEASQRLKGDWIQSVFSPHCLMGVDFVDFCINPNNIIIRYSSIIDLFALFTTQMSCLRIRFRIYMSIFTI